MTDHKVTIMVLNTVDLQCSSCYKKVKKLLCKFPQITNQVYDEKNNKVTIKVLCCSPEKIRDKLCCKGGKVIKSIEILEPPKAKEPEKAKEQEKPKATEKPKETEKPKTDPPVEKSKSKDPAPALPPKASEPVPVNMFVQTQGYPPMPMYPTGTCCGSCYEGHGGGPCFNGYGRPVLPPPGPYYDGYGYGYGYRGSKCCVSTDYFSEENPQGCTIM